jgi:hypothetical protein
LHLPKPFKQTYNGNQLLSVLVTQGEVVYKKVILGAASVFALTAAAGTANASFHSDQQRTAASSVSQPLNIREDAIFDVLNLSNGSLEADVIERVLSEMFQELTPDQAKGFPELLNNLAKLGAPAETLTRAQKTLIALLSAEQGMDGSAEIIAELQDGPAVVQLAQNQNRNRRPRDPDRPGSIGQGGGGGGAVGRPY